PNAGLALSDSERGRLYTLLRNADTRIKALSQVQVSLQFADDALSKSDLRLATRHAQAVIDAPTATNAEVGQARSILEKVTQRQGELAPAVPGLIEQAGQQLDAGDFAASRLTIESVTRSGVELTPEQNHRLSDYQLRVLAAAPANAGMMQPGVIKKREQPSEPVPASPAPATPAPASPAPTPAQPMSQPAEPVSQPAAQPVAQPAPAEPMAQPASTEPAGMSQPAAAQPVATPAQPGDLVAQARAYDAKSILAEADAAFDQSRMKEAADKYQRVLGEYSNDLTAEDKSHAEQRLAEARVRLNVDAGTPGDLLNRVTTDNSIRKQAFLAEFNNDLESAKRALSGGDTGKARDLAASANLRLNTNKDITAAGEFEDLTKQVQALRTEIDKTDDVARQAAAEARTKALKEDADRAAREAAASKSAKIAENISRVRSLQAEMKYEEALQTCENILFLDPTNSTGLVLKDVLRDIVLLRAARHSDALKARGIAANSTDNIGAMVPPTDIIDYPSEWPQISYLRGEPSAFNDTPENRRALAIIDSKRIPVQFNDTPFSNIVTFIGAVTNLNVDADWSSLSNAGIDKETPVTLNLSNVPIRTVLDRVMEKVSPDPLGTNGAAWSMNDGVLTIASREVINKNKTIVIYDIRDLLVEIPNHTNAPEFDLQQVLQAASQRGGGGGRSPFKDANNNNTQRRSLEDRTNDIIQIITNNVDSQGWRENGGDTGFIQQLQGSLIITNTPANHRVIQGLLSQLRAQRALQVNVETRFLLVAQDFFEQIGFDLDVYFNANNNQVRAARGTQPNAQASDFFGSSGQYLGGRFLPNGSSTPIFAGARPSPLSPVSSSQNSLGITEGLTTSGFANGILAGAPALGVAGQFLDDVQVDFLIKATQADRRTVTLTAPRLTFTNGQTSYIVVATSISFVSDLQPVVSESAVGFDPTVSAVPSGVTLSVSGTVSADRRYVTLDVNTATNTVIGFATQSITAVAGGQLQNSAQVGSNIQLPTVTTTKIQTTVTVPDQGTILLGGQRLVTEQEVEAGVPVLSKIPIINRFFTNRTTTKEEQTLLILIKPTVLIQNEQEERHFPGLAESLKLPGN
ncbi:MAG: hypothetical protein WC718_12660, partial [Phycisphaerales bacterium]